MRYVALLSGINLGNRRISMETLAAYFEEYGFSGVRTYISSGNVSFDSTSKPDFLDLEEHLCDSLGFETTVAIFSLTELDELLNSISQTLSGLIPNWQRPLRNPKIEGYRYIVALSSGEHQLMPDSSVPRTELLGQYPRASLWLWTLADGRPPAAMDRLFVTKNTTRFAHTLEKIYQSAL
ncbi:MAG: DUF1697 domain-containing protein [Actinomycetota bacterium]|nr:DUF1697 domain-containing protein [Actinomycetota bacterium]